MRDYKSIFASVEATLIETASRVKPRGEVVTRLEEYKHFEGRRFSDDECFRKLVHIVFYAGFTAATVTRKIPILNRHFPSYLTASSYSDKEVETILGDREMIRNGDRIKACVANARTFQAIVLEYGSFQKYIESFAPRASPNGLNCLKSDLRKRFSRMGLIMPYHFMMDIGLPVLKPDIVLSRIFYRLGLTKSERIKNDDDAEAVVEQGRRFASATGHAIRYIDIVFVLYGQVREDDFGLDRGICLGERPRCELCSIMSECRYFADVNSKR